MSPGTARNPFFDQARFGLIALVVFGHALEHVLQHRSAHALYFAVYAFHIPAFAFLSGVFASDRVDVARLRQIAFGLLAPYALFQVLYLEAMGKPLGFVVPYWLLWYLVSLACWRLMLPLFARFRWPLTLAVALAVGAGMLPDVGYAFSLSRTCVFFPLFLLGHRLRGSPWLERPPGAAMRLGAVAAFALLVGVCWYGVGTFDHRWLYANTSFAQLGISMWKGAAVRLALTLLSAVLTLAFLALVPRRRTWAAAWGIHSLNAYLLHGFLIRWGGHALGPLWARCGAWTVPLLALGALAVAALLSTRWVAWCVRPLTQPVWLERLLWRPPAPDEAPR